MTNKDIILGTNDYRDLHLTTFIHERLAKDLSTITEELCVRGNHKKALQYVKDKFSNHKIFSAGTSRIVINVGDAIIEVSSNENTIDFRFHASFQRNAELMDEVLQNFEEVSIYISWIYDANMNKATVPIDQTMLPVDEMYPFLNGETLDSYYQRFLEARSGILILIGPPGTGKTSFIRGFLAATESSAIVTYDSELLSKDGLFAEFIESSTNTLIIEDADLMLTARTDGNQLMSKFLNVGDGLVSMKGKKIIFSTNLPNVKDIDAALLRPGRCHDIVPFGSLDKNDTVKLINVLNLPYDLTNIAPKATIAEIFANAPTKSLKVHKSGFGFI
jgi:hypothetical protein